MAGLVGALTPGRSALWGLLATSALAWAALFAWPASGMGRGTWGGARATLTFAMWSVMMVAMMAPSVAPTLATFARVTRKRRNRAAVDSASPAFFTSGYLLIWVAFSALATGLQWALTAGGQLTAHAALESATLQGAVLLAAGLFQLTPIKEACLRQCQSPLGFLLGHWQEGRGGALRMGLRHGLFCLGCCWALMLLMFVGGTMSLVWMAGLAAFVLVEKLALRFPWFPRAAGVALVFAGIGVLLRGTVLATG